jgi:hypothetical protein
MDCTQIVVAMWVTVCEGSHMKTKPPELIARAQAYSQLSKAYEADPAQRMFVEQVRRDTEVAHKWLATKSRVRK